MDLTLPGLSQSRTLGTNFIALDKSHNRRLIHCRRRTRDEVRFWKILRLGYLWLAAPRAFTMAGASAERPPDVPTTWIGAGLGFNRLVAEAASAALCFQNTRRPTRLSQSMHRVS